MTSRHRLASALAKVFPYRLILLYSLGAALIYYHQPGGTFPLGSYTISWSSTRRWRSRSTSRCGRENRADRCRLVRTGLRAILFRSTYVRYRIRHGMRHTEALAGRHHRPHVPNECLRYMLIGYARVSKADGSQSLDLQRDALRAEGIDDAANLYHDFASGVRDDWPGLDSCLAH